MTATGFTVGNHGSAAAGPFAVGLSDGTSFSFAGLGAGGSVGRSFACAADARSARISPAGDAAAGQGAVAIPACPPVARLVLVAVTATGFTVGNQGSAAAGAFSVGLSDGTSFSFSALAPGASVSRELRLHRRCAERADQPCG